MGTKQKTWTDGEVVTTDELNRSAAGAAEADGSALDTILTVTTNALVGAGVGVKGITPLASEDQVQSAAWRTRQLVTVSAVISKVAVKPILASCVAHGLGTDYVPRMLLSGRTVTLTDSPAFADNASGSSRTDLLYAILTRSVSATGSRRVKAVDGSTSSQVLNLETQPTVTFAIALGTPAGPAGALPADTATAFNFAIALVTIPNGFTSGVTAVLAANIVQNWQSAWLAAERIQAMRPGSLHKTAGGTLGKSSTPLLDVGQRPSMSRWGALTRVAAVVKHAGASATAICIDDTIDWRYRKIRAQILLGTNAGVTAYPAPESIGTLVAGSAQSMESGPKYTADGGGTFWSPTIAGDVPTFWAEFGTGRLIVIMNYAPIGAVDNNWYMEFEASDQFVF